MKLSRAKRWFVGRGVWLGCLATAGVVLPVLPQETRELQSVDGVELQIDEGEDAELLPLNYQPGFSLQLADEDLQQQISDLTNYLNTGDWAKAFRLLTELDGRQLQVMTPVGGDGRYVLIREEIQRQLLSLPPEGRRAFQLYFDGQASEQFEAIKNHPLPGSESQLVLMQTLVDRLLPSSIGGEAAALLGDMYFERGLFGQAERAWSLALAHGSSAEQSAQSLEAKRALALQRAGDIQAAATLAEGLRGRYGQAKVQAGDQQVDVLSLLEQAVDQSALSQTDGQAQTDPADVLPEGGALPQWHLRFLDQTAQNAVNQAMGQRSYYSPPTELTRHVPPVVADDQRVYFHWLGAVFALDRVSGKLLWHSGEIKSVAESMSMRVQSDLGDPRNYRIALSGQTLLVTSGADEYHEGAFYLVAYDTATGQVQWRSDAHVDWPLAGTNTAEPLASTLLGQVLVEDGWGYAVVSAKEQADLYLRRFEPATGKVSWTISLGAAERISFQYTQVSRSPQPILALHDSLLYVLTNNGALLAADVVAGELKWALRMQPPFGVGFRQDANFISGNQLGSKLDAMANPNGSGQLLVHGNVLYAKEHNSTALYAVNPSTGELQWSAGQLMPDAKLVGVDDKRFYVMDRALQSYQIDGNHDRINKNGAQTGSPDHAGALLLDDRILIYANGKLRLLDTENLDPAGKYEQPDYLGPRGGHLYHFGDLLIAIDTTQITAFKIPLKKN